MSLETLLIFGAVVFVAAVIQGISGFAFGIVVLRVFPYIFGYTASLALAPLMAFVLALYNGYLYRKSIDWQWILPWCAVFVVADLASVLVLKQYGDNPLWHKIMGVVFIFMAAYLMWGQSAFHLRISGKTMSVFAIVSGVIMGAFGVGGPPMAAFFMQACKSKEEYIGTIQMLNIFICIIDVALRAINGMVNVDLLGYTMLGLVFLFAGLLVAKRFVAHMDALAMRKFVCFFMVVSGVAMIF